MYGCVIFILVKQASLPSALETEAQISVYTMANSPVVRHAYPAQRVFHLLIPQSSQRYE